MKMILKLALLKPLRLLYVALAIFVAGGLYAHRAADAITSSLRSAVERTHAALAASLADTRAAFRLGSDAEEAVPEARLATAEDLVAGSPEPMPVSLLLPPLDLPAVEITAAELEKAGGARIQGLLTQVLDAVHAVESDGGSELVGDTKLRHKAYGPLQVRQTVCDDLRAFFGLELDPVTCNGNWELSEKAFRLYVGYWLVRYEQTMRKPATAEVACKIWNGGPKGYLKSATVHYWAKVTDRQPALVSLALPRR